MRDYVELCGEGISHPNIFRTSGSYRIIPGARYDGRKFFIYTFIFFRNLRHGKSVILIRSIPPRLRGKIIVPPYLQDYGWIARRRRFSNKLFLGVEGIGDPI